MEDPLALNLTQVHLLLSPRGIEIDESGRIRFVNPEVLRVLLTAKPVEPDPSINTIMCCANIYQCKKDLTG
jgi:hypothetical protein